ncbi:hypothetical protein FCN77_06065 [Arthrobacter sp. 24S4-2]|uniref:hypothetical protein n=1 Tax=Arthrobacter sp. 24S4-2 TaxID=2575374 RepID=UPI0010C7D76D|nr:hypothetical protein [Arthrobacter sp. 24S4-2]QCO97362.1 hypothetical protein FCN77_06065 [Arthrobacter sp. 24S4-2]
MTPADAAGPAVQFGPIIFYAAALAFFGYGVRRAGQVARDRSQLWTRRLNGISHVFLGIAFCTLFVIPLIWTVFPETDNWAITYMGLLLVGIIAAHIATEVMVKFAAAFDHPELIGVSFRKLLAYAVSSWVSVFRRAAELLKEKLLPDGFRDLQPWNLTKPLFKSEYRAIGALCLCICLLAVMSLLTLVGTGQGALTQIVRVWSVFWVLMVAVSMTPSFTLSWLVLKYAAATGAIQCRIRLRSSLSIVANWVSIGGVIGLLTGALSFLPLRFMATSGVGQEPVSLSLLADLSLAGAVGGFIAAHFAVVFACTASMKNRLAALSLPVLTISVFTTMASLAGINPAGNADYSLALMRKSVVLPSDLGDLELLAKADWKTVLALSEESMSEAFPGPAAFAVAVAGAAVFVALLMLGRHVRSSLGAAAAERRKEAPQVHLAG